MIEKERIKKLNDKKLQNQKFIIYWMQQSQRTNYNHALEYAISQSNKYDKDLVVYFGLTQSYPDSNIRHYKFMIEGLKEVKESLRDRGINFVLQQISPEQGLVEISKKACMIVVDRGYLKIQRDWRKKVARKINCPMIQIESDVVVPVESASEKEEYAAYTIRGKIKKRVNEYLKPVKNEKYKRNFVESDFDSIDFIDISKENIDDSVKPVQTFTGGTSQAIKHLNLFLKEKIDSYAEKRNDPTLNYLSNMSPYIHFGQISPIFIALSVLKDRSSGNESFLEELITRRELSMNFVYYNSKYDNFDGLPDWAKKSLKKHERDKREYLYSLEMLEKAETHDPYWNAAQRQMVNEGKMHGYMRMYWGKKIIEWTKKPKDAYNIAVYLNNKYEIDGRDPNGFAGVAWCFGKHDRPWSERPVFGNIRYMNSNGLKRKFDADLYVKKHRKKVK